VPLGRHVGPCLQAGSRHYFYLQAGSLCYELGDFGVERFHRRSLPHWYLPGAAHFVTYRLAGTLPVAVIEQLKVTKNRLLKQKTIDSSFEHRRYVHKVLFAEFEKYLDTATQIEWLRVPKIASMIRQNLYHHDGEKYHLHSYCIMPNHVHVVLTPSPENAGILPHVQTRIGEAPDQGSPLSKIMHSLKSYTANEANKLLRRSGTFWQAESYDHWIRDDDELERIVNYVRTNPVAANLVSRPEAWYWSSCHDRFLMDGDISGWLPTP